MIKNLNFTICYNFFILKNKVFNWINKQVKKMEKEAKRNFFLNFLLFFLVSTINITVIGLSIWALVILLNFSYSKTDNKIILQIVMACLAAGCNLLIFIFTIFNLIYRNKMKFSIYKQAIEEIQHEYMKFSLKSGKYQNIKNPQKELKIKVNDIYQAAILTKKSKIKITNVLSKSIKEGINV